MSDELTSVNLRDLADRFFNQSSDVSGCPVFKSTACKFFTQSGPSMIKTSALFGESDQELDEDCGWGGTGYGLAPRETFRTASVSRAPVTGTTRSGLLDTRFEEKRVWQVPGYGPAPPEAFGRASVPRAPVNGTARVDDRAFVGPTSSRIDLTGPKVRMDTTRALAGAENKDEESEGKNGTFHEDFMHLINKHSRELRAKDAVHAENARLKAELERASIRIKELETTEKIVEGIRRMRVSVGSVTSKSDLQRVVAFVKDLDEALAGKSVDAESA